MLSRLSDWDEYMLASVVQSACAVVTVVTVMSTYLERLLSR